MRPNIIILFTTFYYSFSKVYYILRDDQATVYRWEILFYFIKTYYFIVHIVVRFVTNLIVGEVCKISDIYTAYELVKLNLATQFIERFWLISCQLFCHVDCIVNLLAYLFESLMSSKFTFHCICCLCALSESNLWNYEVSWYIIVVLLNKVFSPKIRCFLKFCFWIVDKITKLGDSLHPTARRVAKYMKFSLIFFLNFETWWI